MTDSYLKSCHRGNDSLCPIFRLGDIVREAGEKFPAMAVEVGSACLTHKVFLRIVLELHVLEVFLLFPLLTTGGRHWHPDQMGLQPGPPHAALPSQVLLQAAG